jgi:23S rRNA (adenine2503-C2)-methyltransferase
LKNLLDYNINNLEIWMKENDEAPYRAKQVLNWVCKNVWDFDLMTNIPQNAKEKIKNYFYIGIPEIVTKLTSKKDETSKYLLKYSDGNMIEAVVMKYSYGYSICISTQVGCKMGCKFCASTIDGMVRSLTAGEMLSEILVCQRDINERISNVVLMGSGEPLDNLENVSNFIDIVSKEYSLNIGQRHITLSTCGIIPNIYKLAEKNLQITLAISLHSGNNEKRKIIMPIANLYEINDIIEACTFYFNKTKRRITFEYALIKDFNDSTKDALELSELLKGLPCHINLIPVNEVKDKSFHKSLKVTIDEFSKILEGKGIEVTVRRELGSDINAACGQLKRGYINGEGSNKGV